MQCAAFLLNQKKKKKNYVQIAQQNSTRSNFLEVEWFRRIKGAKYKRKGIAIFFLVVVRWRLLSSDFVVVLSRILWFYVEFVECMQCCLHWTIVFGSFYSGNFFVDQIQNNLVFCINVTEEYWFFLWST